MPKSLNLYLFLLEATPTAALVAKLPALKMGVRYPINCFASESSMEAAREPLERFFGKLGWTDLVVNDEKQVPPSLRAIPDPKLREAAKTAAEKGVGFVIYGKAGKPMPAPRVH